MLPRTTTQTQDTMSVLLASLRELDCLYHAGSLDVYEQTWQHVERLIQHIFPGFTIAYAELYNAGQERTAHGGMRHVLLPLAERNEAR